MTNGIFKNKDVVIVSVVRRRGGHYFDWCHGRPHWKRGLIWTKSQIEKSQPGSSFQAEGQ